MIAICNWMTNRNWNETRILNPTLLKCTWFTFLPLVENVKLFLFQSLSYPGALDKDSKVMTNPETNTIKRFISHDYTSRRSPGDIALIELQEEANLLSPLIGNANIIYLKSTHSL